MLAFHNDPAVKEKYIARIKAHAAADEIVKGIYWEEGKGCAVGCTIHSNNHLDYEIELGIPIILARLEDKIFENLPNELAKTWPQRFLESIPVGVDLSKIWPQFAIFLLLDKTQCAARHTQCKIVADKFQQQLDGEKIDWKTVTSAADANGADVAAYAVDVAADVAAYAVDVADAAAYAAAYAAYAVYAVYAAAYAVDVAADAAAYAAAYAAYAADSAAYVADNAAISARQKAYIFQSEKLLELLSSLGEENYGTK